MNNLKELRAKRKETLYKQRTKFLKNLNSRKALCFFVGVFGLSSLLLFHKSIGVSSDSLAEILYAWCIGVCMMAGVWGIGNIKEKEMYLKQRKKE